MIRFAVCSVLDSLHKAIRVQIRISGITGKGRNLEAKKELKREANISQEIPYLATKGRKYHSNITTYCGVTTLHRAMKKTTRIIYWNRHKYKESSTINFYRYNDKFILSRATLITVINHFITIYTYGSCFHIEHSWSIAFILYTRS